MTGDNFLAVLPATSMDEATAVALQKHLAVPLLETGQALGQLPEGQLVLQVSAGIPSLCLTGPGAPGPVNLGFDDKSLAVRRKAGHNELLGRAVGWKRARAPSVLDSTGGFGRDAFLLADLGCDVLICEREPVMAVLLGDAIDRARASDDPWLSGVAARMRLRACDARSLDTADLKQRDVIYLDPMFPLRRKASPGKEMQVLHRLLQGKASASGASEGNFDRDASDLLLWACEQRVSRVVVKRQRRAPLLEGPNRGHSLQGRSVRFDVYPLAHAEA